MREAEEQNNQSGIDPITGQFITPPPQPPPNSQNPPLNGGGDAGSNQNMVNLVNILHNRCRIM